MKFMTPGSSTADADNNNAMQPPRSSSPSSRATPFAVWIIALGLIFCGLDLLYGISPDLSKFSASSDPLLDIMVLFVLLCFVAAAGVFMQRIWGYLLSLLVSLGFIVGANALDAWVPTLADPRSYNTFIVAESIVPVLVLVAVLTILCFVNRKTGLNQKRYLASAKSFSGAFAIVIVVLVVAGALIGAYFPGSTASAPHPVSISIVNGAYNPSNVAGHFSPSTVTLVIGVNNTVTWTNNDYTIHTVTSNSGLFNSGLLNHGNSWTYTFTSAGTYGYHCAIHTFMTGSIVVVA